MEYILLSLLALFIQFLLCYAPSNYSITSLRGASKLQMVYIFITEISTTYFYLFRVAVQLFLLLAGRVIWR